MPEVTERQVLDALRSVTDPDRSRDIVSLGMVSGLAVRDGNVGFAIEVDPARGPKLEPLRKAAEAAVDRVPGVLSVTAVLTAHRPSAAPDPAPASAPPRQPTPRQPRRDAAPDVGAIVAVASGKGGVGKSTTAVNVAMALATAGLSVGILDADIYGPSLPRLLGITHKPTTEDGRILQPIRKFGIVCMSIGFLVPEDSPTIWRGPMVMSALEQMMRDVAWGALDILVVDMPPGTGDAQLTLSQRVPLAGAVIVSTPQDLALVDARKGLNMFRKVDVPVLGLVENMSMFICPHCGGSSPIFGHGGARAEADRIGVDFLGEVPLHMDIRATSDGGTPIVVSEPDGVHALAYKAIADAVWTRVAPGAGAVRRAPPRIVVS